MAWILQSHGGGEESLWLPMRSLASFDILVRYSSGSHACSSYEQQHYIMSSCRFVLRSMFD